MLGCIYFADLFAINKTTNMLKITQLVQRSLFAGFLALGIVTASLFAAAPAPNPDAAEFEKDFMMEMIPHHMMAVSMAEACVDKAVHEDLRSQCEDMIESQTAEVEQMEMWLHDWYGVATSSDHMMDEKMHRKHMRDMRRLGRLDGRKFEIRFMEMMIPHHKQAVEMAEICLDEAYHEELETMCQDMIAEQTREIKLFAQWLCDWYGRCHHLRRSDYSSEVMRKRDR